MKEKENEMLESLKYFYDNFAKISESLASFFKFIYLFLSLLLAFIYAFLFKICDFCKFISICSYFFVFLEYSNFCYFFLKFPNLLLEFYLYVYPYFFVTGFAHTYYSASNDIKI